MRKCINTIVLFITLCILIMFSSCDRVQFIRTVDSLITPPLFYMEYEGLVDSFNSYVGNNVILCNPSEGTYSSAITVADLNGDASEEALVFYRDVMSDNMSSMCLMINDGENWKVKGKFTGYGNEVSRIDLEDIDSDGIQEILVTWNYSGINGANVYSLYRSNDNNDYKEVATESCDIVNLIDLDGDNNKEVFYISASGSTAPVQKNAKVLKLVDGTPSLLGETKVDPNIGFYVSLLTESQDNGRSIRIYVDATKSDNQMITEVLFWDREAYTLINPLYDEENAIANLTLRFEQIFCRDVNGDGRIEIPVQSVYYENDSDVIYKTDWMYYSNGEMKKVMSSIVNSADSYMINLEAFNSQMIGLRKYESQNCWIVFMDDGVNKTGNELFSVLRVPEDRWKTEDFGSYIPIRESSDGVVCIFVTDKGRYYGFDENKLKNTVIDIYSGG